VGVEAFAIFQAKKRINVIVLLKSFGNALD